MCLLKRLPTSICRPHLRWRRLQQAYQDRGWPAARETPEREEGRAVSVYPAAKNEVIAGDYLAEERCKRRFVTNLMAIGPPGKRVYPDYTPTVESTRINAYRAFPRRSG